MYVLQYIQYIRRGNIYLGLDLDRSSLSARTLVVLTLSLPNQ